MIRVVYHRPQLKVTVQGHAQSGEFGYDLVCAGCSALALTLAENLAALERAGQLRALETVLEPGAATLACTPARGAQATALAVFDTVCLGFQLLARQYAGYVSYTLLRG